MCCVHRPGASLKDSELLTVVAGARAGCKRATVPSARTCDLGVWRAALLSWLWGTGVLCVKMRGQGRHESKSLEAAQLPLIEDSY